MRICIAGAGAVGALIGARLAAAGHDVSVLARGATLEAIRAHGLRLEEGGAVRAHAVRAEADAAALGPQDLVVVAVKAQSLPALAPRLAPLLAPDTVVLPAMNGVPWWFLDGFGGPVAGRTLQSVDPGGAIARAIPMRHVLGCVVHLSSASPEPGLARLAFGNRLIVGEPDGTGSARLARVVEALSGAGFEAQASERIRQEAWYKLWGNMTMNPVSAITGATADRILDDPLVARFCLAAMREAAAIGAAIGCPIAQSGEERNAVTRRLGAFRTSMLQDVDAHRPIELDALVGAVHELGTVLGLPVDHVSALLGLARLFARTRGLYPPG